MATGQIRVDRTALVRRLRKAENAVRLSAPEATKLVAREFGEQVIRSAPRDTNRFVRGWAEAVNSAGLGSVPVPPIVPSKLHDKLAPRLEQQAAYWTRIAEQKEAAAAYWRRVYENRYKRANRRDRWERDCAARLRKAEKYAVRARKLAVRAQEELADLNGNPSAVVIFGKKKKPGLRSDEDLRTGRLHTVRTPIYGGSGATVNLNGRTYVRLRNKEPHASIVESRTRVVARALSAARGAGLKKASREVRTAIRKAAG